MYIHLWIQMILFKDAKQKWARILNCLLFFSTIKFRIKMKWCEIQPTLAELFKK